MRRWLWLLGLAGAAWAAEPAVTVVVREAALKRNPQFYASTVATVRLGERLSSSGAQGAWLQVSGAGGSGWIHKSAVTQRRTRVSASDSEVTQTSAEEITLAGKGFNQQVEGSYKRKRPGSNFAAVNALERSAVPEEDVLRFVAEGGLGGER